MVLMNQYAGDNKWEAELKKQNNLLHTCIWKGQLSFLLEGFIAQHRNIYVSMEQYVLSMLNTNCPTDTLAWDTYLRASNAQTL